MGGRVVGERDETGAEVRADHVVVAAGAWTTKLVTGIDACLRSVGQPVFHLRPSDPELFAPERFPVFTADVTRTGYYGFPINRDGVVKIAKHGVGVPIDPDAPRAVTEAQETNLRDFLQDTFPTLVDAPIVHTRLCLYADSQDGDFWIARDPDRDGLTVATGGSGHGFKFGPVFGPIIADAVEGRSNKWLPKFTWRPEVRMKHGREATRYHGD